MLLIDDKNVIMANAQKKKVTRGLLACDTCRLSKVKCSYSGTLIGKCQRCERNNYTCKYSPKVSQLRKKSIERLRNLHATSALWSTDLDREISPTDRKSDTKKSAGVELEPKIGGLTSKKQEPCPLMYDAAGHIRVMFPNKKTLLEVSEIFFKNQYQGIFPFIHKPSFQAFIRSKEFEPSNYINKYYEIYEKEPSKYASSLYAPDPLVLLAILALCARLHPTLILTYGHFEESACPEHFEPLSFEQQTSGIPEKLRIVTNPSNASNYFAWHTRNRLKDAFDSPSIQRVQALTMLSSHEWGETNAARSFLYIGLASRMALVLGMGSPNGICYKDSDKAIEMVARRSDNLHDKETKKKWAYIILESKRRTVWSVYMMDRCISSGRRRSSSINIEDLQIPLPSPEENFVFGQAITSLNYYELVDRIETQSHDPDLLDEGIRREISECSSYAFTIRIFEVWASIGKWVGEGGSREEQLGPWMKSSNYYRLSNKIDMIENSLPSQLKFNSSNLNAHIAENKAGIFGYLHCLLFISRIFLNREYFYFNPDSLPEGWWQETTAKLFSTIKTSTTLLESLSSADLMVVAPFTGFEIFTNAGTSLYLDTFPQPLLEQYFPSKLSKDYFPKNLQSLKRDFKKLALQNIRLLQKWGGVWSLCKLWMNWASQMQKTCKCLGQLIALDSAKKAPLRLALRDYGQNEIVEDNDYIKQNSDEVEKTKSLENLMAGLTILNPQEDIDTQISTSLLEKKADYENVSAKLIENRDLIGLEYLESMDPSFFLPGWYDVITLESPTETLY